MPPAFNLSQDQTLRFNPKTSHASCDARASAPNPAPTPTPLGCPQILKEPSLPTTPPQQRGRTSIIPYSLAPVNTFEASPFVLPRPGSTGLPTASLTRFQRQQRERGRIVGKGGEKGKQEILIHPITKRKRHPERCRHQSSCAIAPSRTGRWTQAQSATLSATSANSGI